MQTAERKKRDISRRIKMLREMTGLSQEDFARKCGTTRPSQSRYEKGVTLPTIDTYMEMVKVAGLNLDPILYPVKP